MGSLAMVSALVVRATSTETPLAVLPLSAPFRSSFFLTRDLKFPSLIFLRDQSIDLLPGFWCFTSIVFSQLARLVPAFPILLESVWVRICRPVGWVVGFPRSHASYRATSTECRVQHHASSQLLLRGFYFSRARLMFFASGLSAATIAVFELSRVFPSCSSRFGSAFADLLVGSVGWVLTTPVPAFKITRPRSYYCAVSSSPAQD